MLMIVGLFASTAHLFASTNAVEAGRVALSPEEREWITRHPVMRAGVLTNLAPFSYVLPDGNLSGINIDILNLISQRTGLRFDLIPQKSGEELLANWDQLDVVCSIAKSPLVEQVADFTKAYTMTPFVIVEREGEETYGSGAVLRGSKIALPRSHLITQRLTESLPSSAPVILAATQEECFELVAKKKADATVAPLFIASQYLNSHPQIKLSISGALSEPTLSLRIAVRRGLPVGILDKGLASISREEMDDIFAKHLLFGLKSARRFALMEKRAEQALIAAAVAGLLLMFWNFFMRKEIRARRKAEAELQEANRSMEVFSHSISHDLRAPLRGMTGLAEALKEDFHEKLGADGQRYLDSIMASGARMDKMITDVLAYSRATSSEWPMETVELDHLVHQIIEGFPPEQRQYFQIDSKLPAVWGNTTLLNQCLGNLLSNAVRFVPSERTPEVVIRATHEDSKVTVFVEDNGIGVDPKDQKRIFQIFERAAPTDYKGTGIGLAVVAKAAERMGGSVGVESEVGQGSRFWIRLPGASAQKPTQQARRSHSFWHRFVPLTGT
ncbi:MAG: sensor histidine kinase [Limisphaerales bacterium]